MRSQREVEDAELRHARDWFASGTELLFAGQLREAIACLRRAVSDEPTHAAHHNLAVALRAQGDAAVALEHACAAELLAPDCASTLALAGSLRSLAGDHAGALATFRRARVVDPDHDVSRYYLGIALAANGDRASAIAELRHLGRDDSRLPGIVRERVRAQLSDLLAGEGAVERDLCSIPLVTELVGVRVAHAPAAPAPAAVRVDGRQIGVAEAIAFVAHARRIVALTGAGISAASGLATRKELWRRHDRDAAVSIWRFRRDPVPLWTVIREFLGAGAVVPNAAHRALAALPRLAGIVTQNVEGLHQAAGTACPVLELHGTLLETRCDSCGARPGVSCADAIKRALPPECTCGGALRPDVVLFGEWVDHERLARAAALCAGCDLLLVVGTAADVAPAADLPLVAAARGAIVIEVKRNPSRLGRAIGALHLAGVAEDVLPQLVGSRP
jgi:NAD-dependent deacetylase